ncbi:hypothetical protein [Borrelia miyamotoi]|uniref:Uncharacterized protein n=1 Tax=Borrelia miyamotoi TaxID=47466 RepID=A0AAQ2WX20_9SPIR|nr:hypothetical protein [Borrelia miyamotoi]AGT27139.1 hypothetical protein I871_00715 [Borrelia miyamotoi LB-2001]AJA58339.1 hypothetical protein RJ61_00675 [Borrelia miyamotoi]AOW95417.1 hypothetical protein AXH25_00685 [Borrelia miyamotoi]QTL83299.1 hypothetical protein bmLB2001_000134 [Borrelia miyamotoi]WAZ85417.1 hypothetical protein O5400_03640 [Borrelia miyamotoi]
MCIIVEIISNLSLDLDFHEHLNKIEDDLGENIYYYKIYNVHGKRERVKSKLMGLILPEENFILIVYAEKLAVIERLRKVVETLKQEYLAEGIRDLLL